MNAIVVKSSKNKASASVMSVKVNRNSGGTGVVKQKLIKYHVKNVGTYFSLSALNNQFEKN